VPLAERPLGPRLAALHRRGQPAVGVQPQHLRLDVDLREPLADHRVVGQARRADLLLQLAQHDLHLHLQRERQPRALVHERRDRDRPALALAADDVVVRDPGLLDEQLVELGLAGDLHERADLHPVLLHVHQEVGEPAVLGRRRVGPRDEHAPLGLVRVRRPHLLAGHHPVVAVAHGARLQRREVGAGPGLGEPLAPDLVRRQDRGQEPLLLLLGAVGDDRRAAHRQPEHVRHRRRARARDLLVEDRLLDHRGARAAVLGRPAQPSPAALVQRPLPRAPELERLGVRVGLPARMVGLYPAADGVTKLPLRRRQRQVH
jgi:hypothetical protein